MKFGKALGGVREATDVGRQVERVARAVAELIIEISAVMLLHHLPKGVIGELSFGIVFYYFDPDFFYICMGS